MKREEYDMKWNEMMNDSCHVLLLLFFFLRHHQVSLLDYNAKHAQLRILPRYKVKSEGEVVQILDQIVFESVKSPGQYFHSSVPYQIDHFHIGYVITEL